MRRYPSVKKLTPAEHAALASEIFSTIPSGYDLINRVFSLRRDVAWRRLAAGMVRLLSTNRFLDIGTGTADLAMEVATRHPRARVIGIDSSGEMLRLGMMKAASRGLAHRIEFMKGNALCLPFPACSFDAVGISFGIRNIPQRIKALREMTRVTVQEGRVIVLELGTPASPLLRRPYFFYMKFLLPAFANVLSANPSAYHYLAESILSFPGPRDFRTLMERAGLIDVETVLLSKGIATIHVGRKPAENA